MLDAKPIRPYAPYALALLAKFDQYSDRLLVRLPWGRGGVISSRR